MRETPHILIAGVGNLLLTDDGVGVHAIRALQEHPIPDVTVADIGTAILHGLHFVESATRVLVIDAAKGGRPPGTIYFYEASGAAAAPRMTSIHAMGLQEAIRFLAPGKAPPIAVIGVEPQTLEYGLELSAPVAAVLPRVVALARETVLAWREAARAACLSVRAELASI